MLTSKWFWTGIAAGAAVMTAGAAVLTSASTRNVSLPEVSAVEESRQEAQTQNVRAGAELVPAEPKTTYLLKLHDDMLSVYVTGEKEPAEQYTVPAGLPDYDRILLEYGMQVNSERELRLLLEDYLS